MTFELTALGWNAHVAAGYAPFDRTDACAGRVSRIDRGICTVLTAAGADRVSLGGGVLAAAATDPAGLPCAGDWVVVRRWPDRRNTIEAVLPRRTVLAVDRSRPLASNVDTVAVLLRPKQERSGAGALRLLAMVAASGARPVLVLAPGHPGRESSTLSRRLDRVAPGVPVHRLDTGGLAALRALAGGGRSLALIGSSGVGRAGLVDSLAGATVLAASGSGTPGWPAGSGYQPGASAVLVPLPGGGVIIDTPPVPLHNGPSGPLDGDPPVPLGALPAAAGAPLGLLPAAAAALRAGARRGVPSSVDQKCHRPRIQLSAETDRR